MPRFYQCGYVVIFACLLVTAFLQQPLHASQDDPEEVTIPFTVTASNNIVVDAILNHKDTLHLMLHTAASDVTLTENAVRKATSLRFTGKEKVNSWGGKAASRFSPGNQVQLGSLRRNNITVWEDKNSGKDTDGKFGLDFFDKRFVELDFEQRRLVLHQHLPRSVAEYERLKIENQHGELLVTGRCVIAGKTYPHRFLLHSGYSGSLLLDDAFAAHTGIDSKIKITAASTLQDSFGHTIRVKKGVLPVFALGRSQIANVPVGFFAGNIGIQKRSVLGSEMLLHFNLFIDMTHNDLYISPVTPRGERQGFVQRQKLPLIRCCRP